jgi:hypothetical protein
MKGNRHYFKRCASNCAKSALVLSRHRVYAVMLQRRVCKTAINFCFRNIRGTIIVSLSLRTPKVFLSFDNVLCQLCSVAGMRHIQISVAKTCFDRYYIQGQGYFPIC